MPTYRRKSNRGKWSLDSIKHFVEAVHSGSMGYLKTSRVFGVSQTTLERKVKERQQIEDSSKFQILKPLRSKCTIFTKAEEQQLVSYFNKMEERLFGLTVMDLRKLVF